jgi:hypothetical protein
MYAMVDYDVGPIPAGRERREHTDAGGRTGADGVSARAVSSPGFPAGGGGGGFTPTAVPATPTRPAPTRPPAWGLNAVRIER